MADLALGTHRCRAVADAASRAAATAPSPWVDTAPNYGGGDHHRLLAPVLAAHPRMGVSTKIGFVPRAVSTAARRDGVLTARQAATGHSLAPAYVRWQADRTRHELGRAPDLVFLHNPERLTGRPGHPVADRAAVHSHLRRAFAVLEEQAHAGRLTGYGVATWSGFTSGLLTVEDLDRLARQAAGGPGHHLRAVQLPVSLVQEEPITRALDGRGPLVEAAEQGWEVFASAPLHGGELPHLATTALARLLHPTLNVAQTCLLAAASCPGVNKVLLSATEPAHWGQALDALAHGPVPPSHLRKALDVLAA